MGTAPAREVSNPAPSRSQKQAICLSENVVAGLSSERRALGTGQKLSGWPGAAWACCGFNHHNWRCVLSGMQVNEKVALVTGASSGLGRATATTLVRCGMRVFGTSRSGSGATEGVEMLALDVDSEGSVQACVQQVLDKAGRVDVLVNNAGRAMVGGCEETQASEARALFETNVFGVMRMVTAVLPAMRAQQGGTLVNVGSLSGCVGVPFHGVYAASKHALAGYTEALRLEVEPWGVRVCLVEPQAHNTPIKMARPAVTLNAYDAQRQGVEAVIRSQIEHGQGAEQVASVISAAVRANAPRPRYRVGRKAAWAAWARLLPWTVFEALIRREFGLPGRQW